MDDPGCDPEVLSRTYDYFRYVNAAVSGWRGVYRREIQPLLSTTRERTLLDIGSGGGDVARALARWAAQDGLLLAVTAIDPDARAHRFATARPPLPRLTFRQALSSDLADEGARFDVVVSNHVLHHLTGAQLGGLLADCERLAAPGGRVLLGDIERSTFAYLGFGLGTWPLFRDSYIRADGLISIRRSFTAPELRAVVPPGWSVVREHPSRLLLRWDGPSAAGAPLRAKRAGSVTGAAPLPPVRAGHAWRERAQLARNPSPAAPVESDPSGGRSRPERELSQAGGAAGAAGQRMRDVIVVGGGPVGILLAGLLAVRGLDVEVLERRAEPSRRSRAIGIHPPSMRALDELGLADAVVERAVRIRGGEVRCDGRALGRLTFREAAGRHPFVVSLPQYETEALLRARFDELSPGRYRSGVTVTDVRDRGDRVEVEAEVAGVGAGTVFEARYVVAADGARSVIRALAGIRGIELGGGDTYLMSDYPVGEQAAEQAMLYFERGGVVESFPLPGGRRRWVAMTPSLQPDASSHDLAAIVQSRTGVVLPSSEASVSAFSVQQRLAERLVSGRIVLVGDAAHQISPIGGQGMNLGWLDGLLLAPALERAIREPGSAASVLADYDRRRRRSARMAARQAGFNMMMGRPATGLRLRLRNGLVRTLAVPPASAVLASAFTMRWL
ncbi:2-polyprenyl-6-methoxyphenol hydroxylase-like FAD-dependent oxidoreductase/2-polyprenyl-3-methyl-5-hydroxy-6-metoxy-1,4-benzoquinol methylase [Cryobacterium psychrotolerans]|nr:2-polyprenyl-6-methoxyphenol hydroxylase-like FAD-dependent oxidoreductase/2-polyprenyl-3-methyl-5-hydroxy-6-metoxy-1,4-benzoquinol methylase [Cryobacterium psychrotolerans]